MGLWCALSPPLISAEDQLATGQQFPRRVQVATSHTYLRAGPGDDFYPTARLIHGETLEIWSVSESGYGAVRPLAGSFSWLRAADVDRKIEEDSEIGVVITDGAVSRIGSQINALRHVAQVRLEAGERVRVLNEVRIEEGRHEGGARQGSEAVQSSVSQRDWEVRLPHVHGGERICRQLRSR